MARLLFIDDDPVELESFREIVDGIHTCTTILWPEESKKLESEASPDLVVSDLYLPSGDGDSTPTAEQKKAIFALAIEASDDLRRVANDKINDGKTVLRAMMGAISTANEMLKRQWSAMGQSPSNGIAAMKRAHACYPGVPFVFYSRKITPEDVVKVLGEGANDAIRKGALTKEQVLSRLADAMSKGKAGTTDGQKPEEGKRASRTSQMESGATSNARDSFSARPTIVAGWIDVGVKAFGLFTAVFTFLLARGKFLEWLEGAHGLLPAILHPTSGSGVIAILAALYIIIYFLFTIGNVVERICVEIMNLAVACLRFSPSIKSRLTMELVDSLKKSVPRIVGTTWAACVVVGAVVPAVRFTIHLLASP